MGTTTETTPRDGRGSLILKSGIAVAVGSAAFFLGRLLSRDGYDGMDSIVSFSSRMIAGTWTAWCFLSCSGGSTYSVVFMYAVPNLHVAARALEEDEDPDSRITFDPLATYLAGGTALARAKKRREKAPSGTGRTYKVGRIAVRTRWFDDQLEECLGMPQTFTSSLNPPTHTVHTLATSADGKLHLPTQVVELGAGLSSRPWRLHLPAVLKWYDVDRQDVIDTREALLLQHGAEVDMMSPVRRSESKNSLLERKIGSLDHHSTNVDFPIRCESRSSVAADVGDPTWIKALVDAGFDASKPTVWIAEGLLMYLEPARVDALLQELASISAPGSCLLTCVVTETCIKNLSENGTRNSLMKEWKSGCPQDPSQWLKSLGWNPCMITTRAEIAESLGLTPDVCMFDCSTKDTSRRGFFIAATVADV